MENTRKIASLRRRRGVQIGQLTFISKRLDEYEKSNQHCLSTLTGYEVLLDKAWDQFILIQDELEELVGEDARYSEISTVYSNLTVRLQLLMMDKPALSSKTSSRDSSNVAEPTSIKLPNSSNRKTFHTRDSSSTRDLKTTPHDRLDRKEPNPVQNNNCYASPTKNIASSLTSIPSHDARSPSHDTRNVSPTRDLTTTTFASSVSQQSDSTLSNALNQNTFRTRDSSSTRDLKITPHDRLDQKELNPVQNNNCYTLPTENIASDLASIPSHDTRTSLHDTRGLLHDPRSSLTARVLTTTKPAFSLSQQSDSTLPNALNQNTSNTRNSSATRDLKTTSRDPLDQKELNPVQGNNGHTPPTENLASNLAPIPSHDTRASFHDTRGSLHCARGSLHDTRDSLHNSRSSASKRDLSITTFASSASQQSDSTPPNALNQSTAQDHLDWKKEKTSPDDKPSQSSISTNPLQEEPYPHTMIHNEESNELNPINDTEDDLESNPTTNSPESTMIESSTNRCSSITTSAVNHLSCITSPVTPNINIASETHSPGNNVKTPSSPRPKEATFANDPNQNNLRVIATVTNHSTNIDSFQSTPPDLNTCPLSLQIATSDKSLTTTLSPEPPLAPTMPGHSPMSKLAQYEEPQKSSKRSNWFIWPTTDKLARKTVSSYLLHTLSIGAHLGRNRSPTLISLAYNCPSKSRSKHNSPGYGKPAGVIPHNETGWLYTPAAVNPNPPHPSMWKKSNQTEGKISLTLSFRNSRAMPAQPSNITKTLHTWASGGSPDLQSPAYILHASMTHLPAKFTFRGEIGEMYNDTSWAEVFHGASWGKLFHDTSWIVNFNGKHPGSTQDYSDPGYQADNVLSPQRPCSRIIGSTSLSHHIN